MKDNLVSHDFALRLEKSVKKKHNQARKRFMSLETKEEYHEKLKIAQRLLEVLLR